jgi:hypothetical protein
LVAIDDRPLPPRRCARKSDKGGALDPATLGHGHDHVLALDHVLVLEVGGPFGDLGPPRPEKSWRTSRSSSEMMP